MISDNEVLRAVERMPDEMRVMFEILPAEYQEAYLTFWTARPDAHGAHRDTLPAFMAGLFRGLRR